MEKRWDILGIGVAAVDDLLYLERFPTADHKMPLLETQRQGGGLTATALVAAARHGARTAYCARLGFDDLSEYTLRCLEQEGVDTTPCPRLPDGQPYHSYILVDRAGSTRTILFLAGLVDPPPETVTETLVSGCRVLLIDHLAPQGALRAARIARSLGIPVVADIEVGAQPADRDLVSLADHLIVGTNMARQLSGLAEPQLAAAALSDPRRACVVVTAGDRGCWYAERGGPAIHQPAFRVDVVDTTGCGDVFHGVYAAALARGESAARAVLLATAAAAMKATRPGGRAGIPGLPETEAFINGWKKI